jgi:hypothetical protein
MSVITLARTSFGKAMSRRLTATVFSLVVLAVCAGAAVAAPSLAFSPVKLSAPRMSVAEQSDVVVPLEITDTTGVGIIAYQFNLTYDPAVLQIDSVPIDIEGTLSESMAFAVNPNTPGLLRVAVYGAYPLTGAGVLLNLRFKAIGASGSVSDLIWEEVLVNEGDPEQTTTNGSVAISPVVLQQTAASVRGHVRQGAVIIPYARVELTGNDGIYRTVLANAKGYFEFTRIRADQTYTLSVAPNGRRFTPIVVKVAESAIDVDVRSEPKQTRDLSPQR